MFWILGFAFAHQAMSSPPKGTLGLDSIYSRAMVCCISAVFQDLHWVQLTSMLVQQDVGFIILYKSCYKLCQFKLGFALYVVQLAFLFFFFNNNQFLGKYIFSGK